MRDRRNRLDLELPLFALAAAAMLLATGFRNRAPPRRRPDAEGAANAASAHAAPRRRWTDIARRVVASISEDRVVEVAAGVTFFALLALFPALAALVSLYGLVADPASIARTLDGLEGLLPGAAIEVIREQLTRVSAQPRGALGLGLATGLALSLWSANSGMKALFDALNVVNGETERRGFVRLNATSLAFTLAAILSLIAAIAAVVGLPVALKSVPVRHAVEWGLHALRWPVLFVFVVVALAILYRYGPCCRQSRWRWMTWGSALAAFVWLVASALFSWYAENFGSYNETYGSLGAVIGFMTWMWISIIVVLVGAEIDAEIEARPSVPPAN